MKRICIDPGHPSFFEGSENINWGCEGFGVKEVELNLILSEILKDILSENGFNVILTRNVNDTIISNKHRAEIAKDFNADLFLRIHADSAKQGNSEISGVRTFYPPSNAQNISEASWDMAILIHRKIIKATNLVDRGVNDERVCTNKNGSGMLVGTYWANEYKIPSVLLETVYLTNEENALWISKKENQIIYMTAVFEGIREYFDK